MQKLYKAGNEDIAPDRNAIALVIDEIVIDGPANCIAFSSLSLAVKYNGI